LPEVRPDTIHVYEDVPTTIPIAALLGNDSDVDGDPLSFVGWRLRKDAGPLNGTIEYDENGDLLFTPYLDATVSSGFIYRVTDNIEGANEGDIDIQIVASNDDPTAVDDSGYITPRGIPLVIRVSDLLFNDYDIEQIDTDGDGRPDVDLDEPNRPRPTFVGIDGIFDPVQLAFGQQVAVGSFELESFQGERFLVARFAEAFSGPLTIQYRIADGEGLEDIGFASATVADLYSGSLIGTPRVDYLVGGSAGDRIEGRASADAIFAMGGNDAISSGLGADSIDAGPGDDRIDGGDDGDRIDGGEGFDTLVFSGSNTGVRADLESRVGQGGFAEGDVYLNIEALIGTDYADELGGNGFANRLEGGAGRDLLRGRGGDDIHVGGAGDDTLEGGGGADLLDGGEGHDTATWFLSTAGGISVSLADGTARGGDAEDDLLVSIEHLIGSLFADVLSGDGGPNRIEGGRGDDQLFGGAGDDTLSGGRGADTIGGGDGLDTVDYSLSVEGVVVDLADTTASRGDAAGDRFSGIEIIQGSYHDDSLLGDGDDNRLRGGRGADLIDGRGGFDSADYSTADEAVSVDLALGQGLAGEALGDTLRNIERLLGSLHADQFIGSAADETFDAGFGNDTVSGGAGSDRYVFGYDSGSDTIRDQGQAGDIDRLMVSASIAAKDLSLLRNGDDLFIELERGAGFLVDTLSVSGHFLGTATGIEEIVFANGQVWDRDRIDTLIRLGRFNAADDLYRFAVEDELAIIDPARLIENDADDVDGLALISVANARFGTVLITPQGHIAFLGAKDHNGDAWFDYTVRDRFGRESTATVEVNLAPVNDAPVAMDDPMLYGIEDQPLRIRLETLLANDTDVDGDFQTEELQIIGFAPLLDLDGVALYPYSDNDYQGPATNVAWRVDGSYVELKLRPDYFGSAGFIYTVADAAGAAATASVEIYISPVNDAPRARDFSHEVRLSRTKTFTLDQLLQEVVDIEGDTFSFVGLHSKANGSAATNGEVAFDATAGTITFTPHGLGAASFYYDVIDVRGAEATLELKLNVRPLNDPPKAFDDYGFRTLEDTTLLINPAALLANDTDENGDLLLLESLARFAENGKVRLTDAGMIEFRPRADYNGAAGFAYTVSDGRGGSDVGFVHLIVLPSNGAPLVRPDVVAGLEDQPLGVIPAEAFGNDSDPEGDVIFFRSAQVLGALSKRYLSAGIQISAELADGVPLPGWLHFDPATLVISGIPPRGAAERLALDVWVHDPETGSSFNTRFDLLASSLSNPLSLQDQVLGRYIIRSTHETALEFGVGRLNPRVLDPRISVSASGFGGSALPAWLVFDAATLRFSGTPPVDATPLEIALRFSLVGDGAAPLHYEQVVRLDPADLTAGDGTLAYDSDIALFEISSGSWSAGKAGGQPLPDWLRFDPLALQLTRSGFAPDADEQPARVQIVFTPTAPVLAKDHYAATDRGFALEFVIDPHQPIDPAINRLLANPAFFQAQGLFALDLGDAAQLSVARESRAPLPAWLRFDAEQLRFSGMPPAQFVGAVPVRLDITGQGGLPTLSVITQVLVDPTYQVEALEDLALQYTNERLQISAPQDFNGALALTYRASDEKGAVSGPTNIVVNVKPMPERPTANPDAVEVDENGSVSLPLSTLLANDFDSDNDHFRIVAVGNPDRGELVVNPARFSIAPPTTLPAVSAAIWSATLDNGAPLPAWLTLDAASGQLSGAVPIDQKGELSIRFTRTVAGVAASASLVQSVDGNAGTTIQFTPPPGVSGKLQFAYTLTDDRQGDSQGVVTVNVLPRLKPPTANIDQFTGWEETPLTLQAAVLLANDSDVDQDPIRFVGVGNGRHGSVRFDGTEIVFTPEANFAGLASFDYQISDDRHGSSAGLVEIQIVSTNRQPTPGADRIASSEDVPVIFSAADLLANDSDPDGDAIRFVTLRPDSLQGRISTLPGGRYQFVPKENVNGLIDFDYTISDGRANATGRFSFDLAPVNDAPIANLDGIIFGQQDTPLLIAFAQLLANDRDVEGDSFEIFEVFDGDNGDVTRQGDQAVFTGRPGYYGDAGFHYRVTDVHGASSVGFVQLTILPNVPLPIGVSDWGFELLEDSSIDIDPNALLANDVAPAGSTLSFAGFAGDVAKPLEDGRWRFTPETDYFGSLKLSYFITNESDFLIPTTVEIEVLPVADAPVANDDVLTFNEDEPAAVFITSLLANDLDVDRQAIVLTRLFDAVGLKAIDNGIGQLVLTPDRDFSGLAGFSYEISDSSGLIDTARVQVEVKSVNDAPVIQLLPVINGTEDIGLMASLPHPLASDADGDLLLVEARGLGGTALPSWLSYDRHRAIFSGVPPKDFHGRVTVELAAFDGKAETIRQVTIIVAPVNDKPTGQVSITGTPISGEMLNVSNTLADADGIPISGPSAFSYHWKADGITIAGATGSSLPITQAQVGKAITVTASYTDNDGTNESSTSAAMKIPDNVLTLLVNPNAGTSEDGTANLLYTFSRTGPTTAALMVNYTVSGTASLGTDYIGIATTPAIKIVTIEANSSTATVMVDPIADVEIEPDETVALAILSSTDYSIGTVAAVVGTILNDDIAVTDVNKAPTALALSATALYENIPAGSLVASLSSSDPNTSPQSFTYALVAGVGDADNLAFFVTGDQLHITRTPDYEVKSTYGIRLRTTDQGGLSFERHVQLAVNDLPDSPSYGFSSSAPIVYEGGALALGISSSNVAPGTQIYWSFSGTGISSSDFSDGSLSGTSTLGADGGAAFTKTIAADGVVEGDEGLAVKFFSDSARTQQLGSTLNVTIKEPSVGVVTDGPDVITGTAAAETIRGVPTGSTLRGRGTVDKLTGGAGNDNFVLADASGVFYDDGNSTVSGTKDMAWITDFSADDKIILSGSAANYKLSSAFYSSLRGVLINALLPSSNPEPIGFVQSATLASLNLTNSNQFTYLSLSVP
jgi:Ca2+-binding RTX toxin-like protein